MNTRIRKIREELGDSREKFGAKIGLSGDVINNLERGRIEIKEDRIKLICSTFDVSETWLKTGEGEMHPGKTRNQKIAEFANKVMALPDSDFQKRFVFALTKLEERQWEVIAEIIDTISKEG